MDEVTVNPRNLGDDFIIQVLQWLRSIELREVCPQPEAKSGQHVSNAVNAVLRSAKKQTYQQTKAFKHRAQVEAIAAQCLQHMPNDCDIIVELGAGQARDAWLGSVLYV